MSEKKELKLEEAEQINGGIMAKSDRLRTEPRTYKNLKELEEFNSKSAGYGRDLHRFVSSSAFTNMVDDMESRDA